MSLKGRADSLGVWFPAEWSAGLSVFISASSEPGVYAHSTSAKQRAIPVRISGGCRGSDTGQPVMRYLTLRIFVVFAYLICHPAFMIWRLDRFCLLKKTAVSLSLNIHVPRMINYAMWHSLREKNNLF